MVKLTALPVRATADVDGTEMMPVVKDGVLEQTSAGGLIEKLMQPVLDSAASLAGLIRSVVTEPAGKVVFDDVDGLISATHQDDGSFLVQDLRRPGNVSAYDQIDHAAADAAEALVQASYGGKSANTRSLITASRLGYFPRRDAATANMPTVTVGAQNAATTLTSPTLHTPASAEVNLLGGRLTDKGGGYYTAYSRYIGLDGSGAPAFTSNVMAIETVLTGDLCEIHTRNGTGSFSARLLVNGCVVWSGKWTEIGSHLIRVEFPSAAERTLRFEFKNMDTMGVYVDGANALSAPPSRPIITGTGDSFWAGTGATIAGNQLANVMARCLGLDLYNSGIGGTGIITSGGIVNQYGNPETEFAEAVRLKQLTLEGYAETPAIGLVWTSSNDFSATPAEIAAYGGTDVPTSVYNAMAGWGENLGMIGKFADVNPGIPLLVVGLWNGSQLGSTSSYPGLNHYAYRDAVAQAAWHHRTKGVYFIDQYVPDLMVGANTTVGSMAEYYTSDTEPPHPEDNGHAYRGLTLADRVQFIIHSLLA